MKKLYLLMILSVLIFLIGTTGCRKQVFSGSSTGNETQFLMEYSILNCTKTHDIKLEKGTTINVVIENKSGNLDIFVSDSNGEKIYKGDNATSGNFSLEVPKTDTYKFSVKGSNAKGSVSFKVAD
ncbi:PPC domain-containing protein [Clostridium tagluense]|uniref:PPC domain-containing protein n=1 Tax=Clostridium tagluense TaxID=360422 RepID=UPI001C0E8A95|nr:PPC domain-containing protein [Clostridium tagluense]MBU3130543.1 PPC domain-containing protein [Clostridium tagluense]